MKRSDSSWRFACCKVLFEGSPKVKCISDIFLPSSWSRWSKLQCNNLFRCVDEQMSNAHWAFNNIEHTPQGILVKSDTRMIHPWSKKKFYFSTLSMLQLGWRNRISFLRMPQQFSHVVSYLSNFLLRECWWQFSLTGGNYEHNLKTPHWSWI